mmetsp:Transcript_116196/g.339884  ORF Transcript_116196/g.339884 Transcript_116196/m.339884 type:complete len:267 (-) Transcript_116196:1227-2027(-)
MSRDCSFRLLLSSRRSRRCSAATTWRRSSATKRWSSWVWSRSASESRRSSSSSSAPERSSTASAPPSGPRSGAGSSSTGLLLGSMTRLGWTGSGLLRSGWTGSGLFLLALKTSVELASTSVLSAAELMRKETGSRALPEARSCTAISIPCNAKPRASLRSEEALLSRAALPWRVSPWRSSCAGGPRPVQRPCASAPGGALLRGDGAIRTASGSAQGTAASPDRLPAPWPGAAAWQTAGCGSGDAFPGWAAARAMARRSRGRASSDA